MRDWDHLPEEMRGLRALETMAAAAAADSDTILSLCGESLNMALDHIHLVTRRLARRMDELGAEGENDDT